MAYPLVKFVEEPASSPVVLLDCNPGAGDLRVPPDDFSLGAPDDEGFREIRFSVMADASYDTAADGTSAVSRILQRPEGWLMFQRDASYKPVFAHWYRDESSTDAVVWEYPAENTLRLPVTLSCDEGLYAEPEVLSAVTITNNPASGTNKASYALPAIKGDLPSPLKVDIVPITVDWTGYQPFMATTAYDASQSWAGPILWDLVAAQFTAGSNTGGDTSSSAFVGGSYRETTFSGTAMSTRLSGSPSAAPVPGTYKVLLRCQLSTEPMTMQVRMGQMFNLTQTRFGPTKTIVRPDITGSTVFATWVDLGEWSFPFGAQNLDLADAGSATVPSIVLQAARVSGSGAFRWDCLLLIPVATAATVIDSVTQTSRFHGFGLETDRNGVWDGLKERFAAYNFGTALADIRQPDIRGGWLQVVPGANNVFHLLQQSLIDSPFFTDAAYGDVITQTSQVTLSYLPCYRHLRPTTE